jgi:hypothetical protein
MVKSFLQDTLTSVLAMLLIGLAGVASAAPSFIGLQVGFAGRYKVGVWTPVKLTVRGGDATQIGSLRVTVLDDEGMPSQYTAPGGPSKVQAGRETTVCLYVRFGRPGGSLLAEFLLGDEIVARRVFEPADQCDSDRHFLPALETNQPLLLLIGSTSTGIAEALGGREYAPDGKAIVVVLPNSEELPGDWYGYEGVDKVIVATSLASIDDGLHPDAPQIEALDAWVRQGGKLLLCAGSQAERIARADSPWSRFLPGRLKTMVGLRQTGQLETYAGSTIPVPLGVAGPDELRVPQLVDVKGVVELCEADLPLLVRTARGFGEAAFLATDLDQPPLLSWKGRRLLIRRLLDQPAAEYAEAGRSRPMMHHGFLDTAGQLRKSLNRFDGIQPTPFWLIIAILSVYIVLIGPLDYYLVRYVARRMILTWVTFPAMIVIVSATAYFLTWDLKGGTVRLHQVDVVDVDATAGLVRGTSWAELFSPRADAYNLAARAVLFTAADRLPEPSRGEPRDHDPHLLLSWFGLAGTGLGGMAARTLNPALRTEPYHFAPCLDRIFDLPMQTWSTRSLTARWTVQAESPVRAKLMAEDRLLSGVVTNDLAFPLTKCRLAYGPWSHDLGTLEPGKPIHLGPGTQRCELQSYPTGQRTPYDRASLDSAYILQAMTFHAAVGGTQYTGLLGGHQRFVDLSGMLSAGQAVLVGFAPATSSGELPGLELLRDGRPLAAPGDEHLRVYRFVFPVKESDGRQLAAPHPQFPHPSS